MGGTKTSRTPGMPAWVTQDRDDEVWAQVAFLRALPDLTPERYAELALGGGSFNSTFDLVKPIEFRWVRRNLRLEEHTH